MQTTNASWLARFFASFELDAPFLRLLVLVNGGVPLALLGLDAWRHQLGVNSVNFAIRTTGLLALLFLLFSLAITPLRRWTGWNVLIAPRRTLGLYGFFYLCVHFAIFFGFDRGASVSNTVHEIVSRRYLQIGTLALALLMPLAITSTDAMVARLGAKRWKNLHRFAYLATSLGALHYYLLVKADVRQPLVFAAVLFVLLSSRVVWYQIDRRKRRAKAAAPARLPRRFWSGELRVLRVFDETPDVRTFRLGLDGGADLPFVHRPGQYLNIALSIDGVRVNRSYTIASSPTQSSYCELTVKRKPDGRASRHLHDALREGATVKIAAPAGRFVFTGTESNSVLLIAGGVGITPLMAMIRYLTDRSWAGAIYLIFVVRNVKDIIFSDELARLEKRFPNLHLVVTLSGEAEGSSWRGLRGRISPALLENAVPDLARLPVYLCGPETMMADTRALLLQLGVPDAQIKTEAFVSGAHAIDGAASPVAVMAPAEDSSDDDVAIPGDGGAPDLRGPMVRFARSKTSHVLPAGQSILEAAEDAGVDIPFECRSGICGQCKTRLLRGMVTMDVEDALSAADKAKGLVLACQSRSVSDVEVDA